MKSKDERYVEVSDGRYLLHFGYDIEVNDMLREAGGFYDPQEKAWVLYESEESAELVEELQNDYEFEVI
jgi:hypothetical protein